MGVSATGSDSGLISPATVAPASSHPARLGVLASGNGSNFEAIMAAIAAGQLNATVTVVIYNRPQAGVVARANGWNIPTQLLDHRQFESRADLDDAIVDALHHHGCEWVIMAGWMRRVTQRLIDAFPRRILNIHPSLLPSFPGLHAVDQALDAGVKIAGCTVHYVELEVDSGPIIMQAAVPVLETDTAGSLQQRIQKYEHQIYPAAIALATQQSRQLSADSARP